MHPVALQARTANCLAATLDDAGGDAQALGAEYTVLHALAIPPDVVGAQGSLEAPADVRAERGEDIVEVAVVEFVVAHVGPEPGAVWAGGVERLGDVVEMLLGVEDIRDWDRAR